MFRYAIPVIGVRDADAAAQFYAAKLGFTQRFSYPAETGEPRYMGFERDGLMIHVASYPSNAPYGIVVVLVLDGIDALHDELVAAGVEITLPPTDQTWGVREMHLRDPDGNRLNFMQLPS